ncbi:MAG: serine protease [Deltaproteobacteria bacterium]|nr:serine protease [Deltaproteobacteria bacterium]
MHLMLRMACGQLIGLLVGCGVSWTNSTQSTAKVIGGEPAAPVTFMLGITEGSSNRPLCGASLVASGVALTSAHCVKNRSKALWVVAADDLSRGVTASTRHRVQTVDVHPDYDFDTRRADIAVLTFDTKHVAPDAWQPISLDLLDNTTNVATVLGWGVRSNYGDLPSDQLQSAQFPIIDNSKCKAFGAEYDRLDDTMICAGHLGVGQADTCHGDSGGPLYVTSADGKPHLLGVVSWGHDCSEADQPGTYTKVSAYRSWLDAAMRGPTEREILDSGAVMAREVMRHCRDELQQKTVDWQNDHQLSLNGNLNSIDAFSPTDERPAPHDAPTCTWTTASGHTFYLYHNALTTDHLERQQLLVKDAVSGSFYKSNTQSSVRAQLTCNTDLGRNPEPLLTIDDESIMVRFGNRLYRYGGNIPHRLTAHPVPPRDNTQLPPSHGCEVLDYGLTIIGHEHEGPESGLIVHIKAPLLGPGEHEFIVPFFDRSKAAEITFARIDGHHGTIELHNSTGHDIVGWQLECDRPFVLEAATGGGAAGGVQQPQKVYDFGQASSPWLLFAKDQTLTTAYRSDDDFGPGQKVICWINHIPLKVLER